MSRVSSNSRSIMFILDGLGDRPSEQLHGKTPLEAAFTPNMDQLAATGVMRLVAPVPDDVEPHTHTGIGALLGLPEASVRALARGPVEAAGAGVELKPGDVAMRANFATLMQATDGHKVIDRRAGRITGGTQELASALDNLDLGHGVRSRIQSTDQHRAVVCFTGASMGSRITNTDPGNADLPAPLQICQALSNDTGDQLAAEAVNRFSSLASEILEAHPVNLARRSEGLLPANGILLRGAGGAIPVDQVLGGQSRSVAVVAGCRTVIGMGKLLGFDVLTREGFTADAHTRLDWKLSTALIALQSHDLVVLHFKAPDLFAHDRDPAGKMQAIERFDASLEPLFQHQCRVAVCADHGTDSNTGLHITDPVPTLVGSLPVTSTAGRKKFGETECRNGHPEPYTGTEFLSQLLKP